MIWKIGQFPELDQLNPEQRAAVLARVPRWTYPLLLAGALVIGVVAGSVLGLVVALRTRSTLATLAAWSTSALLVALYVYHRELGRLRAGMRKALAERPESQRPPFCSECGHDLRAVNSPRCPKCGATIPSGRET